MGIDQNHLITQRGRFQSQEEIRPQIQCSADPDPQSDTFEQSLCEERDETEGEWGQELTGLGTHDLGEGRQ